MSRTNCKVHMEFIDISAVVDGSISTEHNATIGNVDLLKEEADYKTYAIPDQNTFLLDGNRSILRDNDTLPFVSSELSAEDCVYENIPAVTVTFSENHTSAGITLYFLEDYPAKVKLTWYDSNGVYIISGEFLPDSLQYFYQKQVSNYRKLKIEFLESRLPGQRTKLGYIKYGKGIDWTGNEIKSATVSEQADFTGATIPINTVDISIIDFENNFDLHNQNGVWKSIQKRQPVVITENADGEIIPCGIFYLDTWKSQSNVISFSLIDRFGLMGKTKYYKGQIYVAVEAGIIIESIMESAGIEDYIISEEVAGILLTGHIPICTHREALQQVLFACGAMAECCRTGTISIYMPGRSVSSTIGTDRKFLGTTIELDDYVSGVAITYGQYNLNPERKDIYKDTLPAGDVTLEFSEPYTDIEVTGGTLVEVNTNYVSIHMDDAGECTVTGCEYVKTEVTYTANAEVIEAGEEPNIVSFGVCSLFNLERVKEVAERLLSYYQLRQIVNMRYLTSTERSGDWVSIRDAKGGMAITGIESQTIDLTGGFISSAKCRGYSKVLTDFVYAGELLAGERGLI